jgi:hypothetical protein
MNVGVNSSMMGETKTNCRIPTKEVYNVLLKISEDFSPGRNLKRVGFFQYTESSNAFFSSGFNASYSVQFHYISVMECLRDSRVTNCMKWWISKYSSSFKRFNI